MVAQRWAGRWALLVARSMEKIFRAVQPVIQLVIRAKSMNFINQRELGLFGGVVNSPAFLPAEHIVACASFRAAVRLCWTYRRSRSMTLRTLAELIDVHAPHVTDYLHRDDSPKRRNLPADKVAAFESVCGNRAISQWMMRQSELHIAEEVMHQMRAA